MNIGKELKKAIDTGTVHFGIKQAEKGLKNKNVRLFIVSKNCIFSKFQNKDVDGVKIYRFEGNSTELGSVCGLMYNLSIISIVDPGQSAILALAAEG